MFTKCADICCFVLNDNIKRYILNILKDVLPCLPEASAKQAAETLLVLMAGGVQRSEERR